MLNSDKENAGIGMDVRNDNVMGKELMSPLQILCKYFGAN